MVEAIQIIPAVHAKAVRGGVVGGRDVHRKGNCRRRCSDGVT
jgi:hypothetical protein